jgi:rubrerythrin
MNRFERVVELLDASVGGPSAPVGAHRAFWRNTSRNDFVIRKVYGLQLLVVGDGANSNLVKALKGESPFGADLDAPPPGAEYSRMPAGLVAMRPADIAFIQRWIDEGCLEDEIPASPAAGLSPGTALTRAITSFPFATRFDRSATIAGLMVERPSAERDTDWLKRALQIAIRLELATLPPYLTASWSIKDENDPAYASIMEIWSEEMSHFGLACNLLVALDDVPVLTDPELVPKYPGPLPGGVLSHLQVTLRKLDRTQAKLFMDIEYPEGGPLPAILSRAGEEKFDSIGEFYDAILATFQKEKPALKLDRQLVSARMGVTKMDTLTKVEQAIAKIKLQGEGSRCSPEEQSDDLAHYYRFGEIYNEKVYAKNPATGHWDYDSAQPLPMPETWNMADIPEGGYCQADVPNAETWDLINTFDQRYSNMLRLLQDAWLQGEQTILSAAISEMRTMGMIARQLVPRTRPDGAGNYGPCFRYVP